MYGVCIALILYFSATVSGLSTVGWEKLSLSKTPIVDIATKIFGKGGLTILFGIAIISMSNTLLMGSVASSRFLQAYSKENIILQKLKLDKIDSITNTPLYSIVFISLLSIIFIYIIPNFDILISMSNFSIFIIFIIMNLGVIILRKTKPEKLQQ